VELSNFTTLERLPGTALASLATPHHPMVEEAAALFFAHPSVHEAAFPFSWKVEGEVPVSRGLGSSVALRLGILGGLNALLGGPLSKDALFDLCNAMEGHPDNAGPGVWGGFFLASATGRSFRCPVSEELRIVVLVPGLEVLTESARAVLPEAVSRKLAARNVANASCLTAAFVSGDYGLMRGCFDDYLHQPYRRHLVPRLMEVISAGVEAGALGGYLSGSGSTMACLCLRSEGVEENVGKAMAEAFGESGLPCDVRVMGADNTGLRVVTVS
jgi:homoserine kinase